MGVPINMFDPNKVTIKHGKGYSFFGIGPNVPHVKGNTIYFPRGYVADFSTGSFGDQHLFVHELTHVYQHQVLNVNLFSAKIKAGNSKNSYIYNLKTQEFSSMNIEQQAEAVADAWAVRSGYNISQYPGVGTLDEYKSVVPFFK